MQIIALSSSDYCIYLHSAAPRAVNDVMELYAVRLAYAISHHTTLQMGDIPGVFMSGDYYPYVYFDINTAFVDSARDLW